jgi:hypothetical protein
MLQDLLLLGCVVASMYGAWWAGWKLGWLAEPSFIVRTMVEHAWAVLNLRLGLNRRAGTAVETAPSLNSFQAGSALGQHSLTMCHFVLDPQAMESVSDLELEFRVAIYAGSARVVWVDPQHHLERTDRCFVISVDAETPL